MNQDEKLSIAKDLAIIFLNLPVEKTDLYPIVVQHPFYENGVLMDENGMFEILAEPERFEKIKEQMKECILNRTNINSIVLLIRKSYRLTYIYYLHKEGLSIKDCGNILAPHWTTIETLTYDVNVKLSDILRYIKAADKNVLMDKDDLKKWESLPDEVTIYRGCKSKTGYKACSWSLDEDKARWFAERWNGTPYTFKAKVKKEDVIAYLSDRDEAEAIVNYNKLYDIEQI